MWSFLKYFRVILLYFFVCSLPLWQGGVTGSLRTQIAWHHWECHQIVEYGSLKMEGLKHPTNWAKALNILAWHSIFSSCTIVVPFPANWKMGLQTLSMLGVAGEHFRTRCDSSGLHPLWRSWTSLILGFDTRVWFPGIVISSPFQP